MITRFALPFAPFAFDFFVRLALLNGKLHWWQIPDIKTFSITSAFFCLLIAMDIKSMKTLPSDEDYHEGIVAVRRRFAFVGILSVITFGCATGIEASERRLGIEDLSSSLFPWLIVLTAVLLIISVADSVVTNLKYKISYAA